MSVIGYDIGNTNCVIAVTRKRGIDVIANEASRRTTACWAGFDGSARAIGEPAQIGRMRNLKNTITDVKRLLGRKFSDEDVQREIAGLPYKVVQGPEDSILVDVQYGESREQFTPEQIMAMILSKLQQTVQLETKQAGGACVISVPSYWGDAQHRAMRDSAAIAGVNCLRLVCENTAAALSYGFYKQGLSDTEPVYFMVFDMGHASTSVSIMALTKGKLSVVATAADRWLGGRDFDGVLAAHFAAEFKERYKLDVGENRRAYERLLQSCEKLKTVLSANPQAPLNIECLMNDVDVSSKMDRDTFLAMAEPLLARIEAPVRTCIEQAKRLLGDTFSVDSLETVEVIGGSSRVPAVQARLSEVLGGRALSHTLDKSETVSKGAALMCAILSPQFRVREFKVEDATPYAVRVSWGSVEAPEVVEDSALLFERFNAVPSTKKITFQRTTGMFIEARYDNPEELLPGTPALIGRWNVGPIPAPEVADEVPKIKVKIKLDLFGVVKVESAIMSELEAVKVEEVKEAAAAEGDKDATAADGAKDEAAADGGNQDAAAGDAAAAAAAGAADNKEESKEPAKRKLKHTQLPITPSLTYTGTAKVQAFYEREGQMAAQDKLIRETNERRNDVESYVYDMRSKVGGGALEKYAPEAVRESFCALLNATEDWLYEEGEDALKSVYEAKLKELKAIGDPITRRSKEAQARPAAVDALRAAIAEFAELSRSTDAKYEHIEEAEREKIRERCAETEAWLNEMLEKQAAAALCDDPPLTVSELGVKRDALGYFARPIMNKPKPAPKKEEAAPASPAPAAEQSGEEAAGGAADAGAAEAAAGAEPTGDAEKAAAGGEPAGAGADMEVD